MKKYIKDGFLYFAYILGAEYIGLLVANFLFILVKFFNPDNWDISFFVGGNAGAIVALLIMCSRFGYKDADEGYKFAFKETIPFIIGLILYILLNVIMNYKNPAGLISMFLTKIFVGTWDLKLPDMIANHRPMLALGIIINALLKYPFMVIGYKKGINKRNSDRAKLFSGSR